MGSVVKKITKPIKKIVKSPIGKAALIGAIGFGIPGTQIGGLFGRASFGGQTAGLFKTKGIGPLLSRVNLSRVNPFAAGSVDDATGIVTGEGFLRPALRGFNRLGTAGKTLTIGGAGLGLASLLAPQDEDESDEEFANRQAKVDPYLRQYYQNVNPQATKAEVDDFVNRNLSEYRAMGGMVGQGIMSMGMPRNMYLEGGKVYLEEGGRPEDMVSYTDFPGGVIYMDPEGNPISKEEFLRRTMEAEEEEERQIKQQLDIDEDKEAPSIKKAKGGITELDVNDPDIKLEEDVKPENVKMARSKMMNKRRSALDAAFDAAIDEYMSINNVDVVPIDIQNSIFKSLRKKMLGRAEGGIAEIDLREKGGFVPMGKKEKADDVPAMLSKNEFVMTADAVRGIGNGNVEKGAQRLYNLMGEAEKAGRGVA